MFSKNELRRQLERCHSPVLQHEGSVHQQNRRALTLQVLECLPDYIDDSGIVSADSVTTIIQRLYEDYRASRASHQRAPVKPFFTRIEKIMAQFNAIPGLTVLLPPHAIPIHRSTSAPPSSDVMQQTETARQMDQHIEIWRKHTDHPDRWLLECALHLSCRVGMSASVLIGTLVMLRPDHYKKEVLHLPVQKVTKFPDTSEGSRVKDPCLNYPLPLPRACQPSLNHCCRTARGGQNDWLFSPTPKSSVPTQFITRENRIKERLNDAFKAFQRYLIEYHPEKNHLWQRVSSFSVFSHRGAFVTQQKGCRRFG
ncbi:hypothetical protein ACLUEY_08190 [Vreelandella aquamarina]